MIRIAPTRTRIVDIHHPAWDLKWCIQFPEAIMSVNGVTMMWQQIQPDWIQKDENTWAYEWRTTPEYIAEQLKYSQKDSSGKVIRHNFQIGLALDAELSASREGVEMLLTLTNESSATFYDVVSDGGCLQARSAEFQGQNEVERSYIMAKGSLVSMGNLHRTVEIRTTYLADPVDYEKKWLNSGEWFWGRSDAVIDRPAILGAVSTDGSKAVVLGYEGATSASQNADGHHCLHSRPYFGDIPAGESVARRGYILFGSELRGLAERLRSQIRQ